jgi:Heterokaryon incompatibility protein (HET)
MVGQLRPYSYTNLDTEKHRIRLLHLQSRQPTTDAAIDCRLETVDLDGRLAYEALSYEWGSPTTSTNQFQITLNGSVVAVRENLLWALYHLRHESDSRSIWVDAVCINQNNISERNHQVSQMEQIYSRASRVVAWFGRQRTRDNNFFIDFVMGLNAMSVSELSDQEAIAAALWTSSVFKWDALVAFCQRKYWTRLWIIQEIVLASDLLIQCGSLSIPWDTVSGVFSFLRDSSLNATLLPRTLSTQRDLMNSVPLFINDLRAKRLNPEDKYRIPLVDLLLQFMSSECHETRDKAFGVLSLCEDCCRKAVPADYAVDIVNLSIKITIHHQSQHSSSDGAQTATIARNVFRAMGMLYTHNEDHEIPSVLTFRGGDTTIPIDTLYGGRVVWLSAPDNHVKPHIPFPPVLDPQRHYETRALYYVNGEILYFNPTLTNACNGKRLWNEKD